MNVGMRITERNEELGTRTNASNVVFIIIRHPELLTVGKIKWLLFVFILVFTLVRVIHGVPIVVDADV